MQKLLIQNVSKWFLSGRERLLAVKNVSLRIEERELCVVVGPSGCGKSTLLNLVAGFILPSEGTILLDGEVVYRPGKDRGFVFQRGALFPWMRVQNNVEFGLKCRHVPRRERRKISNKYINLVGLQGAERKYPHELSGGMQQRAEIARALANDPLLLLMDEPFAALDAQMRDILQTELLEIWRRTGKTILFITHNVEEAVFLGTKIVVMTASPGQIKAEFTSVPGERGLDSHRRESELKQKILELVKEEVLRVRGEDGT